MIWRNKHGADERLREVVRKAVGHCQVDVARQAARGYKTVTF